MAELGWTRKSIKDVIGVTPLTFRPPYGDIDDRVRAIALAMGMRPALWTGSMENVAPGGAEIQWDSQGVLLFALLCPPAYLFFFF